MFFSLFLFIQKKEMLVCVSLVKKWLHKSLPDIVQANLYPYPKRQVQLDSILRPVIVGGFRVIFRSVFVYDKALWKKIEKTKMYEFLFARVICLHPRQ